MFYENTKGHPILFSVIGGSPNPDKMGRMCYSIVITNLSNNKSFQVKLEWGFVDSDLYREAMAETFCRSALRGMAKDAYDMTQIAGDVQACTEADYSKYFNFYDFGERKRNAIKFAEIIEPDKKKWAGIAQIQE